MRGLSGLVILLYLSLLCTPQHIGVRDTWITSLADSQLQAVPSAQQQGLLNQSNDQDEPDHNAVPAVAPQLLVVFALPPTNFHLPAATQTLLRAALARAPPLAS